MDTRVSTKPKKREKPVRPFLALDIDVHRTGDRRDLFALPERCRKGMETSLSSPRSVEGLQDMSSCRKWVWVFPSTNAGYA